MMQPTIICFPNANTAVRLLLVIKWFSVKFFISSRWSHDEGPIKMHPLYHFLFHYWHKIPVDFVINLSTIGPIKMHLSICFCSIIDMWIFIFIWQFRLLWSPLCKIFWISESYGRLCHTGHPIGHCPWPTVNLM
jgi:hypothetical protein